LRGSTGAAGHHDDMEKTEAATILLLLKSVVGELVGG
jgi:hypothetical protein